MLATFAGKVADMLSVRFTNLISIADKFSGMYLCAELSLATAYSYLWLWQAVLVTLIGCFC
jgi:hypothetical protein